MSSARVALVCLRQGHDLSAGTPASALINTQELFLATVFFFMLASHFLDSGRIGTATFSKQMATTSCFNTKNFFSEVPKKLVNSENNENLIINCENKNLIFEVFRLTLEYF